MEHRKSETESHCFTQLQANQKSQQDEIENRLKEIQHEVNSHALAELLQMHYKVFTSNDIPFTSILPK